MGERRPKGSGGISQRADGLWVARVDAGWTPQGTRRRLTVSSKSKAECQSKLRALQRKIASGDTPAAGSARVTVKSWSTTWLPMHATKVRPTTYTTDAGALRKWVIPTVGHRRLADLTPADTRALRAAITGAGRSTTTALHAHKLLIKMLRDAVVEGHTVPQQVFAAPRPAKATNDRAAIPQDQALRILAVAIARPDGPRWVAALLQGMRQGEALGLRWSAVDLEAQTVNISWQLQHLSDGPRPDGWEDVPLTGSAYLTRPKTEQGKRVVPLVPWMTTALRAAQEAWTPNPWDLIWPGPDGLPQRPEDDRAIWHGIQAEAGVKHPSGRAWHVHECRHTVVSMLSASGVDRSVVEKIVGHARLVESYLHVGQEQTRQALDGLAVRLALTAAPEPGYEGETHPK